LFAYLRTGSSRHHGAAAGPMAPVIEELKNLPEIDVRAMASYLASFNDPLPWEESEVRASRIAAETASAAHPATTRAARLYEGACASCHEAGPGDAQPLGLSGKLFVDRPDNFIRLALDGFQGSSRAMPGFRDALDDGQIADLVRYARQRFAPGMPAWEGVEEAVARLRLNHVD
jgi:nicotinate dehydrogenase subunit B